MGPEVEKRDCFSSCVVRGRKAPSLTCGHEGVRASGFKKLKTDKKDKYSTANFYKHTDTMTVFQPVRKKTRQQPSGWGIYSHSILVEEHSLK